MTWSVSNKIDDDLNPAMADTREITNQNLSSEMKVIEGQNDDSLKPAVSHQPSFEELKTHIVQKISAVEYAAKPGKVSIKCNIFQKHLQYVRFFVDQPFYSNDCGCSSTDR